MEASTPVPPPPPADQPPAGPPPAGAGAYPVLTEAPPQAEYHRLLPLVKWLLALPHYVVLFFLAIAVLFAKIYAFFAVLFTGTYPRGAFDFVRNVFAWSWRVSAYVILVRDEYPPFSLQPDPSYPARFDIEYPEHIDNWRPLVQWLLVIPYAIVAALIRFVAVILAIIGIFVILFTAKLPAGMYTVIWNALVWQARGTAYAGFMVDRYPPFEWEEPVT